MDLKVLLLVSLGLICVLGQENSSLRPNDDKSKLSASVSNGFIDDVVVESTLSVRKKTGRQGKQQLTILKNDPRKVDGTTLVTLKRDKRQGGRRRHPQQPNGFQQQPFGFQQQPFGQFQQQPLGFQNQKFPQFEPIRGSASNAAAQAQGFESHSPFGNFGASAANAGSQGFSYDENGIRGNAGLSGSQSYHLPNGNTLAISYANGFNVGPDGKPTFTNGNSIAYTGANGQPINNFNFRPQQE